MWMISPNVQRLVLSALARGGYEIAAAFPGYGDKPPFAIIGT